MAANEEDIRRIWSWNSKVPQAINQRCVTDIIAETVARQPEATAISAWDGDLTYLELDRLSGRLAHRLHSQGVQPGSEAMVVLCFNKSKWTSVAMLGVMKAGGISVALDVGQPVERLSSIVEQAKPSLILCSSSTKAIASTIGGGIVISLTLEQELQKVDQIAIKLPRPSPEQILFVTFTSGSTGKPKGAPMSHANVCAAVHYQGRKLGFNHEARVLDFAPYCFDVAWSNFFHAFCSGGCLCIPSADGMVNDLALWIDRYEVTLMNVTPTILRTLDRQPTSLTDVLLSGEPADQALLSRWADKVRLKNTYGPSECTFKSTFAEIPPDVDIHPMNIGRGVGAVTWIVDPEDQENLAPIGDVGELWLEGPLVGQGYVNEEAKTQNAFIRDPKWLVLGSHTQLGRHGRLYRTGDLVKYAPDGSIVFVGRKDRQVKICGCRVELGDVEHHIRKSLRDDGVVEVVVEAIIPRKSENSILVAFLSTDRTAVNEEKLARSLPRYMIPSTYIHMPNGMPRTATGKTDRRRLCEIGASSTLEQLLAVQSKSEIGSAPTTPMEQRMLEMWAAVLNVDVTSLGTEDSFLERGGDSVRAIRLVGAAREQGFSFSVADIFRRPRLKDFASVVLQKPVPSTESIEPFSLLKDSQKIQAREMAASCCGVESSQIRDIFPCTPFQAGLFALTLQRSGAYISTKSYELRDSIDIDRFKAAWEKLAQAEAILRTRIVCLSGEQLMQAVVQDPLDWSMGTNTDLQSAGRCPMALGAPLARFALRKDQATGKRMFVWTMHHALHDGWSRAILLEKVERAYANAMTCSSPPFALFVKHVLDLDEEKAMSAWKDHFKDVTPAVFPALPSQDYQPKATSTVKYAIDDVQWLSGSITPPTVIQTALSMLIQEYTNSSDVAIGTVVTGRDAAVDGTERMTGPTVATVPFAISLQKNHHETVQALLSRVQQRSLAMRPWEQVGLAKIRQASPEAGKACDFQTLLVVQPIDAVCEWESAIFQSHQKEDDSEDGVDTYALMISCQLMTDGVQITAKFDPAVIEDECVRRLLGQLKHVIQQLSSRENWQKTIREMNTLSGADLKDIRSWNAQVPGSICSCVHTLLDDVAQQQLDALAIHAWGGDLTYGQLDSLSYRVARNLIVSVGVKPGDVVALCFEKSMWTSVAILGVMKAGAATITFDVTQPEQRLQEIVQQSRPCAIVASPANMELANRLAPDSSAMGLESLISTPVPFCSLPAVRPDNSLFIVFTSGSTGVPKGIVITHENFSSALIHQNKQLGFSRARRTFDFASYAFDAAYYNLLHTLYAGGCLCVPSESERHGDISGTICRLQANFANLTPQVAGLLDDHALQQLDLLELSGESADPAVVARLRQHTAVRFAYGPAECSVLSTVSTTDAPISSIGRGLGVCCWVVDCRDADRLAPLGCIGELWVEGPLVCRGYFENFDQTAAVFIEDPKWLLQATGRCGRVYRTGDLVRYDADGSLIFVGRSNTQTKIRGQRIELTEVANHVQKCLNSPSESREEAVRVIAEVAIPFGCERPQLVAFLVPANAKRMSPRCLAEIVGRLTKNIHQHMSMKVPSYMIPHIFLPLHKVPLTASGKVDRQNLRNVIQSTRPERPKALSSQDKSQTQQLSGTEQKMRSVWARILKVEERLVDGDLSFWSLGGDSISAISLVVAIRKEFDVDLGVSALARHKTTLKNLSDQVEAAKIGCRSERQTATDTCSDSVEMKGRLNLLSSVDRSVSIGPMAKQGSVVFLTGATGFLGTQILCDLLSSGRFEKIVVLVRAMNGLNKVRRTAQVAGWWSESAAQCIEVWKGDLSKTGLGLTASQWNCLAGKNVSHGVIDTIIHNGAAVHWTADYETLKATNVDSTFQLMELAIQSPRLRRFIYISGGRSLDSVDATLSVESDASGYVRTKGLSESMVLELAHHARQPRGKFAVVKPGLIIGSADHGIANVDDFLWRLVRSCIRLGAFPRESVEAWLPIASVGRVSQAILQQTIADQADPFTAVKSGMLVRSFWAIIQSSIGCRLAETDMAKWLDMMHVEVQREQESHPLWPVQQFLGKVGVDTKSDRPEPRNPESENMLRQLTLAIARNMQYLKDMGLVDYCGASDELMAKSLMTRSKFRLNPDAEVAEQIVEA